MNNEKIQATKPPPVEEEQSLGEKRHSDSANTVWTGMFNSMRTTIDYLAITEQPIELMGRKLAEDDPAGRLQSARHLGIALRNVASEDLRVRGSRHAGDIDNVLERKGNAVERSKTGAGCCPSVGLFGGRQRGVGHHRARAVAARDPSGPGSAPAGPARGSRDRHAALGDPDRARRHW